MSTMTRGISDMEGPLVKYVDVMDGDVDLGLDDGDEEDRQAAIRIVKVMEARYAEPSVPELLCDGAWCDRREAQRRTWSFLALCREHFTEKHKEKL